MNRSKTCPPPNIHPPIVLVLLVSSLLMVPRCAPRKPSAAQTATQPTPAASHAFQNIRIREIMGRLTLPLDLMPQEVDPGRERQRLLGQMSVLARELEENAGRIPEVLEYVQMGEEHRREFLDYASQLEALSAELGTHALRGDPTAARATMKAIDVTCQQCHERFRVLPLTQPPRNN